MINYLRKIIKHNSPLRLWFTRLRAPLAALRYPLPQEMPRLIGVTGTDGKTTTVEMIAHILDTLGVPAMTASSYALKHGQEILSMSKRTTASPAAVRRVIRRAAERSCRVVVLEASSHSLVQWRLFGIRFDVAVLTNITHEHLNFHGTREHYAAAKKLLFTQHLKKGGASILPTNDEYGAAWLSELESIPYSPPQALTSKYGTTFEHEGVEYSLPVPGAYNASNALAAAQAVHAALPEFSVAQCLDALRDFSGVPGRMELLPEAHEHDLTVIIDFAITERAMESTLSTARELAGGGRVIVVFGASGGQHDASVHPGLARAAATGADTAIITDDEPYDGDPSAIRANLLANAQAAQSACECKDIADRREAIRTALCCAQSGDTIVVSGLGHYTSRTIAGTEVPWSDVAVLREELVALKGVA